MNKIIDLQEIVGLMHDLNLVPMNLHLDTAGFRLILALDYHLLSLCAVCIHM